MSVLSFFQLVSWEWLNWKAVDVQLPNGAWTDTLVLDNILYIFLSFFIVCILVHVLWNCSLSSMSCSLSRQMHATCDNPLQSAQHAWTKLTWHALHHAGPALIIHCERYLYHARECNGCCRGHRDQWTVPWYHAVCLNVHIQRLRQLSGSEWVPDLNWPEHIQTHTNLHGQIHPHL